MHQEIQLALLWVVAGRQAHRGDHELDPVRQAQLIRALSLSQGRHGAATDSAR